MDNKKLTLWIIVAVVAVVLIGVIVMWGRGNVNTSGEKQTIKIGATLPLTGDLAFLGESYKNAMLLAIDDAKANGNLKYDYKIILEDDKFNPGNAATTTNKLVSVDRVDALASFGSPVGNVVSPIAEKNKIVHINGIASDPNVAKGDYNFVHWTPPYEEVKLLLSELSKRGVKNAVLIEQNQPGVLAVTNSLRDQIKGTGINLVATERFNAGETDYRTVIEKAKSNGGNADIWLVEALSPDLEIIARQIKEAGITKPLTCVESFEFTDKPELFEGYWFVDAADMQQWFVDAYTKKYNTAPKLGAGNGYDVVKMIISAFESTGNGNTKPSENKVQKFLSSLKGYDGAMGKGLSIDSQGIVVTKAVLRMISGGKIVNVK